MKLVIVILLFNMAGCSGAGNIFYKFGNLRFGSEIDQTIDTSVDASELTDSNFLFVNGKVLYFPGEHFEPRYFSDDEFQEFKSKHVYKKVNLNLKSFPSAIPDTSDKIGTFIIPIKNIRPGLISFIPGRLYHPISILVSDPKKTLRLVTIGDPYRDGEPFFSKPRPGSPRPSFETAGDFYVFVHAKAALRNNESTATFSTFYVGSQAYLNKIVIKMEYFSHLISGAFLFMSVFFSFIFLFRLKDKSSLYIAIYSISCFCLTLVYTFEYDLEIGLFLDVFTIINISGVTALQHYLIHSLRKSLSDVWLKRLSATSKILWFLVLVALILKIFPFLIATFALTSFASIPLIVSTIIVGIKNRSPGVVYFSIGAILNLIFQTPIILGFARVIQVEDGYFVLMASLSMGIALALVYAKEFSKTYQEAVKLGLDLAEKNKEITFFNKNLEHLVKEKTAEIRVLLDHIPQGVLSIGNKGIISKDYSAHLLKVLDLETLDYEVSFKNLVLDKTKLSDDQKDQIWQSILVCVGQNDLNFDANKDKFPSEIVYGKSRKVLKVTWNYQKSDDDTIDQILVTLLDITAERDLAIEAQKHKSEIIKIEELIMIDSEKSLRFFESSETLLLENKKILENCDDLEINTVRNLYVNAHTIKGTARILHLKSLTELIHIMEDSYSRIIKNSEYISNKILLPQLADVIDEFNEYRMLNEVKLNRIEDKDKITLSRSFLEEHHNILDDVDKRKYSMGDMKVIIREQTLSLTKIIYEFLPDTMSQLQEKARSIAVDLDKPIPYLKGQIVPAYIPRGLRTVLDNCMVHILRNILDHGIESPEERKELGKQIHGSIFTVAKLEDNLLHIEVSDDGRGLAIAALKEKGLFMNIIHQESSVNEVANIIFESGISTAKSVSQVSGRGIGMCAVKDFLENEGGSISIKLGGPKDDLGRFYDFCFLIVIPLVTRVKNKVKAS